MFDIIDAYVSSGQITPQVGYLYLLIANGCNDKEELAIRINATIRTVERNFRILADLGLTYSKNSYYYVQGDANVVETQQTTAMSPEDLKDFKIQDKSIYISRSNDEIVEIQNTAKQIASFLSVNPTRVEEAMIRAIGSNTFYPDAAFEACFVTRQRMKTGEIRSSVGYFCIVLRNMYRTGAIQAFINEPHKEDKPCKEWEQIKKQLRSDLGKSSFTYIIEPTKAVVNNGVLELQAENRIFANLIEKEYLYLIKRYWQGEINIAN